MSIFSGNMYLFSSSFYPTALKGGQCIVFTHQSNGWAGGGNKFVRAVSQKPQGVGSSYLLEMLKRLVKFASHVVTCINRRLTD